MTPVQMISAVDWARRRAGSEQRPVAAGDLAAGVRHVTSAAMAQVSTRVTPSARWSDLILAAPTERAVRKVAERARHQDLVRRVWGLGATTRRRGTSALFNGPPGTGKTLAAEVLACELGVDLYVVDLDTVVDLDEVFHAAEEITAMLLFEGADALLGTVLRRLDRFDGLAVLTASLGSDLDEVFARRIDVAVEFTLPDAPQRQAIWRRSLPAELPLDADVDVAFLGDAFTLSGGQIRTICVEAAFLAADDGGPVRMEHLIRATAAEQRKLGPVPSATEFHQHLALALRELAER
jgi:SpoVK/Ycf46/Vps4 family AAA+-type ATPase